MYFQKFPLKILMKRVNSRTDAIFIAYGSLNHNMQKNILFSAANFSQGIVRSYARRVALKTKNANPGIQKRLNILEERDESNLNNVDVEEFESDFMNVGEVHREHEKELKYYHEKEKYWIVKQKYFKENKINFLTWNDKEQIRYLHQSNPTEWSIEKLSDGFPALPKTITKIIKSKWHIKNNSKKRNHDEAVENNWKMLREGKLSNDLPPNLLNHLIKFSARKQEIVSEDTILTDNTTVVNNSKLQNNHNEFLSIVSNYENNKLQNEVKIEQNKVSEYCKNAKAIDSKLKSYGNKEVTLNMIKESHVRKNESENIQETDVDLLQNIFQKTRNDPSKLPQKFNKEENNVALSPNDNMKVSYPEKIKIPKDKYKKGCTYKVNDCYYDDGGEFLYRVPGMY